MKFEAMFQPIQIGPMTVANRFVMSPMGNNFANTDGTMSEYFFTISCKPNSLEFTLSHFYNSIKYGPVEFMV